MIKLFEAPFDEGNELAVFRETRSAAGAIVSFTGYARADDGQVQTLDIQAHPTLTQSGLVVLERRVRDRFEVDGLLIIHRFGSLRPGEAIVLVAAAAKHRRAAFDAVDFAMDCLKTEAIFWKKERRVDGDRWIEARPDDALDRKRWDEDDER